MNFLNDLLNGIDIVWAEVKLLPWVWILSIAAAIYIIGILAQMWLLVKVWRDKP